MKTKLVSYIFCLVLCWIVTSCSDDNNNDFPVIADNLATYINTNTDFPLVTDSLIACAFGGQQGIFNNPDFPLSILFYPEGNATDFQYFETDSIQQDPDDLSNYNRVELQDATFFNGYLHRFLRQTPDRNLWCRVTYIRDNEIHISNPINLKLPGLNTEYNPDLLTIDQSESLSPAFTWQDGITEDNVIYFHAMLDASGDLISGTYTLEKQFQFYKLDNVVLNIRDVDPAPSLTAGQEYTFTLMGVSLDNWVNLLADKTFIAQ